MRADMLTYLRDEAKDFTEQAKTVDSLGDASDPASLRQWGRANNALVALVIAVAGEPRPRRR